MELCGVQQYVQVIFEEECVFGEWKTRVLTSVVPWATDDEDAGRWGVHLGDRARHA